MFIQSNVFRRRIRPYPSLARKDMTDLGVFSEHRREEWQSEPHTVLISAWHLLSSHLASKVRGLPTIRSRDCTGMKRKEYSSSSATVTTQILLLGA